MGNLSWTQIKRDTFSIISKGDIETLIKMVKSYPKLINAYNISSYSLSPSEIGINVPVLCLDGVTPIASVGEISSIAASGLAFYNMASNSGSGEDSNSSSNENIDANDAKGTTEPISNGKIEHVLTDHTHDRMNTTINKMMEKGLSESAEKLLNKKSFFNPSWSEQKVIDATNQAYNKVLSQGFINGEHTVKVFGENITVYLENGVFHSAYGDFKLTLLDFGF